MDRVFGQLTISEALFNWFKGVLEETQAELLEFSSGKRVVEIFTFSKSINFNGGLVG